MKKTILILSLSFTLIASSAGGFLYYDWHTKTYADEGERLTYLYSWTDKQGQTHFSDKTPPPDAKNIDKIETLKAREKTAFVQMKEGVSSLIDKGKKTFAAWTGPEEEITEAVDIESIPLNKQESETALINKLKKKETGQVVTKKKALNRFGLQTDH